ncbi:MAG: hypothetical protein HOW73_40840 [Polyangiaceae bacterium]|nr:hypothetical protein [Polyangiaceae bacterium]
MSSRFVHLFENRNTVGALVRAVATSRASGASPLPEVPGPWIEYETRAPSTALTHDFIRALRGEVGWFQSEVPLPMFSQWALAAASKALVGVPWPVSRGLNAGCRIERHAPIMPGEPIGVRVRIESADVDERRVFVRQTIETSTKDAPIAWAGEQRTYIPLKKRGGGAEKLRETVPMRAKEIAEIPLSATSARDFAVLTGDVNPIHWFAPAARAAGFRSTILHGYGSLAFSLMAFIRARLSGRARSLRSVDARFVRPVVLPMRARLYGYEDRLLLAEGPGGVPFIDSTIGEA